ncbi:glycosyl hydrolase 53 family protein [Liquorilactobacillus capillatus]|uniref:Arabinogalactan endo-beta-1,4-galactanase n=1 Tax=Liquorilactobacillus capillatus DSM 19910 TaxID=1423731 RepID=A0A0R1M836_9LACO|nr:glycosyl hydrolase 53 family protein [Liquorilactobacillus capillatus]KRL00874.1 hypothetical protein FC81_GL001708 [Liquorilactobacillus capillatus DSM 19910]
MIERKLHYKMYKAGKNWIYAALATAALAVGVSAGSSTVHADTVNGTDAKTAETTVTETSVSQQKSAAVTTSSQIQNTQSNSQTTTQTQTDSSQKTPATAAVTVKADSAAQSSNKESVTEKTTVQASSKQATSTSENEKASSVATTTASSQTAVQSQKIETTTTASNEQKKDEQTATAKSVKPATVTRSADVQAKQQAAAVQPVKKLTQKQQNGKWYLYDENGKYQVGFQQIADQNKTVYYNTLGQMQYGQQRVQNNWYLFDKNTGAMQTGFQKIPEQKKTVYYNKQGQMQHGQQQIQNNWYLFDKNTGAMQTGFQDIPDQRKKVYYNDRGQMQYGQQRIQNNWYLFDKNTGAMQTGFQNIPEQNKTVYYNNRGQMQHGQQQIRNNWYLFDLNTGAMTKGFYYIVAQNKMVYYNKQGQMLHGTQKVNGRAYQFNGTTGALNIKVGQQLIDGHWYLFNNKKVMQTGFQNIANQGKTVYYNNQGQMQYGQQQIQNSWYLFDKNTGAMQTGFQKIPDQNKTVYYNNQGRMQYGQQHIQNNWYLLDKNTGAMQTGFQKILDQNKTVYYNNQGQMQYGQQHIQNNWYLFDKNTGAMQTGFQKISDQNKTVYYNNQGQMQYAWQTINKASYYFDKNTGAMTEGTVRIDGEKYDFGQDGILRDQNKYDIQAYRDLTTTAINVALTKSGKQELNTNLKNSQDNYAAYALHDQAQLIAQGDLSDDTVIVEDYLRKNANMNGTVLVYRANVKATTATEAAQKTAQAFGDWYNSLNDKTWSSLGVGGIQDLENTNGWTGALVLYKAVPDTANTVTTATSKIVYKVDNVYKNPSPAQGQEQLQKDAQFSDSEVDNTVNATQLTNLLRGRAGQEIQDTNLGAIANSVGGMTTALVGTKEYTDSYGAKYHYEFWLEGQNADDKEAGFVKYNKGAVYGGNLIVTVSAEAVYDVVKPTENTATPTSKMTNDQITAAYKNGTETGLKYEQVTIKPIAGMTKDMARGVDISSYIALKNAGVKFYDFDGKEASLIKVLHDAGVNYLRLRIWNDPYDRENNTYGGGASDEASMLEIAREASQYGMKLALDLQYSDFWTDPGKQVVPKAWKNLTNAGLEQAVYLYTKKIMADFNNTGATVGMVQVGNEITNGLLGIIASRDKGESYSNIWNNSESAGKISDYLAAGAHAIRETTPDAKVVIHIETPNIDKYSAIMDSLKKNAVDYDVLGSSYYPFWSTGNDNGHGLKKGANTPENLIAVEKMVKEKYNKQFVVLETGWVNSLMDADGTGNSISSGTSAYSVGPQGQVDALSDMYKALVHEGGLGAFYWEPAWIPVRAGWDNWKYNKEMADIYGTGWAAKNAVGYAPDNVMYYNGQPAWGGTTWDNVTLFDAQGYPLQSLKAYKEFISKS